MSLFKLLQLGVFYFTESFTATIKLNVIAHYVIQTDWKLVSKVAVTYRLVWPSETLLFVLRVEQLPVLYL